MNDRNSFSDSAWENPRPLPRSLARRDSLTTLAEPFQWQLLQFQLQSIDDCERRRPSRPSFTQLYEEFRTNERDSSDTQSVHTEFQEQMESVPPTHPGLDEYDPPPRLTRGYMETSSPFALESTPVNEMSFMDWYPKGQATLTYPTTKGQIGFVLNVDLSTIELRCPLLAAAFEDSLSGPKLHLETLTDATVWPFLRFLYTDSYALATPSGDYFQDVPTSVLLHCQLYRLADIYELPNLKTQAYVNVLRQCEFGCSSPDKPIDLCEAIRYLYGHLASHEMLIDAILNYCVSCFITHRLGEDPSFKDLAYNLRPFHQALCWNSMAREFENETAAAIIQMPYRPHILNGFASKEELGSRLTDVVYHFHSDEDAECLSKKRKQPCFAPGSRTSALTLALRPRQAEAETVTGDQKDEVEGLPAKRRALSNATSEKLEPASTSDDEYEIIPHPAAVEAVSVISDDDLDDSEPVSVARPAHLSVIEAHRLPIRNRPASAAEDDSDSEWSLV